MKRIFLPLLMLAVGLALNAHNNTLEKLTIVNAEWQKNNDGKALISQTNIGSPTTYTAWIAAHLMLVENTLRQRDVSQLSVAQQQQRKQLLDELHVYWQAGIFPINSYTNYKTPVFIDAQGTHCAVGYLMQQSGHDELAQRINREQKFAYVHGITVPGVGKWADEHGFTADELAWIQPGYPPLVEADNLDGGVNGTVNTMVADATGQVVYIGGNFTQNATGNTCSYVAAYISGIAGYDWIGVGNGTNGPVNTMLLHNNKLYVGGSFTSAGSVAASNVAVYDINTGQWQALGAGLNGEVNALAMYNGNLYAGGKHTDMASKWNGTTWNGITATMITGEVRALEVYNNELIIGGKFDVASGAFRENVIGYDGTNLVFIGMGTVTAVNDFAVHEGKLFAACDIVEGTDTCALAVYNDNINMWQVRLKGGADAIMEFFEGKTIKHIESDGTALICGGDFWCGVGMSIGSRLMKYTQETHDTITYNVCTPLVSLDSAVHTFVTMNGQLYFGGEFNQLFGPSSMPFNQVASIALQSTGIEGVKNAISIQAYPNPTNSQVKVQASKGEQLNAVEIFDIAGRKVLSTSAQAAMLDIDVAGLPSGVYNVRAYTVKGTGNIRLIKN